MSTETPARDQKPPGPDPPKQRRGIPISLALPLIVIAAVVASVTVLIATHHTSQALPGNVKSSSVSGYDGESLTPRKTAPSFGGLRNYLGRKGRPRELPGQSGLRHLPLHPLPRCLSADDGGTSQHPGTPGSGESKQLQIVAVSVDPHGDTRQTVAHFVERAWNEGADEVPDRQHP